ncbi:MAG: hypothetical protein Roseis2KO_50150 [Roseivirga sp.]
MSQGLKRAASIPDIYAALLQKPLTVDDLNDFFIETSKARGERSRSQMARFLKRNMEIDQHLLFAGYRGCGKSTELKKLEKDLRDQFLIINFSVYEELDPTDIGYLELIIVTMERLFTFANDNELDINKNYIKQVQEFLFNKEIEDITNRYMEIGSEVGSKTTLTIPLIQKFFANLKASLKLNKTVKTSVTQKIEPYFSILMESCNSLIKEIKLKLNSLNKEDLLIIIEDLDKVRIDKAQSLFFDYVNQITQLKTNVIFTFPIALQYNNRFRSVKDYFYFFELPMIKVAEKDGTISEEGVNTMVDIVRARMDLSLFEDIDVLKSLIAYSGGCLRDLFMMILNASENTEDEEREQINTADKNYAVQKLKKEYSNTIADHLDDNNNVKIKVADLFDTLTDLAQSETKKLDNTEAAMVLRQNLTILGYNGEGWCDVHPIVKLILQERQ